MNGGAWLRCEGEKVDVLLRDLNVVEYWTGRANEGEFETTEARGNRAAAMALLPARRGSARGAAGSDCALATCPDGQSRRAPEVATMRGHDGPRVIPFERR